MFLYGSPEDRVPEKHPLRPVRAMVDAAQGAMSGLFDEMYAKAGRPSIAPERLLRALLLQALYSIRSERMLVERMHHMNTISRQLGQRSEQRGAAYARA